MVVNIGIQKPFNLSPKGGLALDLSEDNVFRWSVSGAIQTSYALEFRNNATDVVLHTVSKISGYSHSYTLPSGTITNGLEIKWKVQIWDESDSTATSDWEIFQSSSRPVVTITSPTEFDIVESQSYTFEASYTQAESVELSNWQFLLYNSSQIRIIQSDLQTTDSLEYLYNGLQSDETYYVEFQATSERGLTGTSGLVEFNIQYPQPHMQSDLTAENIDNAGVRLRWGVVQIIGDGENYSFIDDEKVDVTAGKVWFDQGFDIVNDFTLKIWLGAVQNTIFNINLDSSIIASDTAPVETDVIWLDDPERLTEQELEVIMSDAPVGENNLWIDNSEATSPQFLGVSIDVHTPEDIDVLWFDLMANMDDLRLLKLKNDDNENLTLFVYNGTFYLYKNGVFVDSLNIYVDEYTEYYIYIQQIGDTLVLGGEAII